MQPAIALTFDNLGEAADLERGLWPAGRPLGRHPSVTTALPRLIGELDALGLRATFCVEALNCEVYPGALRELATRGHELALHGWRHERWDALSEEAENETLARGRAAFAALGLDVAGFRPPGGELTGASGGLLDRHGFAWCSPAGERAERRGRVAYVPFRWRLVDAYHVLPSFAALRQSAGDPAEPSTPDAAAQRIIDGLDAELHASERRPVVVILHPFLMVGDEGRRAAGRVLAHLGRLARDGTARVAPAGELAASLR
jgi:peptidoglycan/xylan/chitin deacetylase (PgdA/CDA1 family)